jgi:putative flippase GtrA
VSLVSTLYQRFRLLIHEGAKFLVVGGIGFIVTLGGADVLHLGIGVGKYTSITIATIAATVVTFVGNRYWTFRHREGAGTRRESVMFFVLNGIGLLFQYACIWVIQDLLGHQGGLWYNIANLIGIVFGTLFRFWSYRKWVWHMLPVEPTPAGAGVAPAGPSGGGHEGREPALVPPEPLADHGEPNGGTEPARARLARRGHTAPGTRAPGKEPWLTRISR